MNVLLMTVTDGNATREQDKKPTSNPIGVTKIFASSVEVIWTAEFLTPPASG
jgi:hypothetical protein